MKLVNILKFIETQHTERYRAFIIWGEAMSGKTDFARRLAQTTGGYYLDLLEHFAASPELKEKIDVFGPVGFRDFLLKDTSVAYSCIPGESPLVIVDNMDFLLNTWSDTEKCEFVLIVEKLDNVQTDKVFCFMLQRDDMLFEHSLLRNTWGEERVIKLRDIQEL